nr:uracil-DNA glycosylase [Methylicorpusculum oleiharenae]
MGIDVWVRRFPHELEPGLDLSSSQANDTEEAAVPVDHIPETPDALNVWQVLQNEVAVCRQCDLCESRTQTVFGSGNSEADWMIIGEAPGQSEDQQGLPFVGVAGQLLTEMLRAIGLSREDVFITNILKCRPPNNRDPHKNEVAACHPYLARQIKAIKPKIILAVGRIAAQNLLNSDKTIGQLRGQVHDLSGIPLVVVYHPAYLLRSLLEKRKAWQDLQLAMATYQAIEG